MFFFLRSLDTLQLKFCALISHLLVELITLTKSTNCVTHQYLVSSILLTLFSDETNLSGEMSNPHAAVLCPLSTQVTCK